MPVPYSLESGTSYEKWAVLTSFGSDIDLATHVKGNGQPARMIELNSDGNIVVTKPDGVDETLSSRLKGNQIKGQVWKIKASGTTVTEVTVYW